ncbi:MAG: hypothetical protein ACPGNT_03555, partial [Rhodospirillales bacterium]
RTVRAGPVDRVKRPRHGGEDMRLRRFEEKSDRLLIFAVDASGSAAMTRLADMVAAGRGGPRDDAAALRLYLQAQDRDGRAALELGNRYRTGLGVDGDACLAKAWYAQAARMGEASARPLLESLALASLEAASGCGSEASDLDRALRRIKGPGGAFYSGAFYSGAFYSGAWRGLR